ncbi:uncharacterized protein B4U80_06281 [Leptotrombidium deliense]|uniref:Gustatory receptor n=1 Tax=Leptotrombidium deliense TaxID=299467 RepID=A0A443SW22_9ACAR|nr:uncharacterized protein B4U80_06281 [Leptotrombidium deliense]
MLDLAKSDVLHVLQPILLSLQILGLWPKDGETFLKKMNILSRFIFFYMHFYALHNVINWLFTFHRDLGNSFLFPNRVTSRTIIGFYAFLENASLVIRTVATTATFDMFFNTHHDTVASLVAIDLFPPLFMKTNLRNLRAYILTLVAGSWIYVIIQLAFTAWTVATMDTQTFMNYYFYGFHTEHVNVAVMRFIMALVWFLYIAITLSGEIFLKTFYIATCLLLGRCARSYNMVVSDIDKQEIVSGEDINRLNKLHTQLCDLVIGVDKNFTNKAFIWVATIFLNICTKIGAIVVGSNASETSAAIMDIVNYVVIFLVFTLTAADVSYQCEMTLPIAHRLASKADMNDLTVLYQAKLMISKMGFGISRLTGWNCFVINRPFIVTVFSAILTYSVVLMQMNRTNEHSNHSRDFRYSNVSTLEMYNETTSNVTEIENTYSMFNVTIQ